jgi:hypothetical protein
MFLAGRNEVRSGRVEDFAFAEMALQETEEDVVVVVANVVNVEQQQTTQMQVVQSSLPSHFKL